MVVKGYAAALAGVEGIVVSVEACAMPFQSEISMISVIGLPDHSIKESLYRCESAILQSKFNPLRQKQIISLSPADLKKEGSGYDLPIAIVMLAMSFQIGETLLSDYIIMGELALDGKVQPIKGVLSMAILAKQKGFKGILIPHDNANEASAVRDIDVIPIKNLEEAAEFLAGRINISPWKRQPPALIPSGTTSFSEIKGQSFAKRGLEIACAGGHNAIMIGPPGVGKTMMANSLQSILPPMTAAECLETTQIHSIAGAFTKNAGLGGLITQRIVRSPHHSVSHIAMVGGGNPLQPGEISLAHNGVLFLDELPEFHRNTLESLRQPLEEKEIHISRSRQRVTFPANFMLIASMNPCPCGYYNHPNIECQCSPSSIAKYLGKISGPLLDRIDLHIPITPTQFSDLTQVQNKNSQEEDGAIRQKIIAARKLQQHRFEKLSLINIFSNSQMAGKWVQQICTLDKPSSDLLKMAMEKLNLSARGYHKLLKIARTISDLEGQEQIQKHHLAEAIQYRNLDRHHGLT
jgi:magnesium chelatase family protein